MAGRQNLLDIWKRNPGRILGVKKKAVKKN